MGLLIQTSATLSGKLARMKMAVIAEVTICDGMGIDIQNNPFAKAFAVLWR